MTKGVWGVIVVTMAMLYTPLVYADDIQIGLNVKKNCFDGGMEALGYNVGDEDADEMRTGYSSQGFVVTIHRTPNDQDFEDVKKVALSCVRGFSG